MRFNLSTSTSRRRLLSYGGTAFIAGTAGIFTPPTAAAQALTVSKDRGNWRFCGKCQVIFYADARENVCAADGKKHVVRGYNFFLPFDVPGTPKAQTKWYCCKYCRSLFYAGYPQQGRCPATQRAHEADRTFHYVLPHDVPGTPKAQNQWRFCSKCFAMFYNGYPGKGVCAADKQGHVAQGYDFVLPHDL